MDRKTLNCMTCKHGDKDVDRKPCDECISWYVWSNKANMCYEKEVIENEKESINPVVYVYRESKRKLWGNWAKRFHFPSNS